MSNESFLVRQCFYFTHSRVSVHKRLSPIWQVTLCPNCHFLFTLSQMSFFIYREMTNDVVDNAMHANMWIGNDDWENVDASWQVWIFVQSLISSWRGICRDWGGGIVMQNEYYDLSDSSRSNIFIFSIIDSLFASYL